jgi:RNA 2',3'-cyclic 3'-phosphodiesterase
LSIMTGVEGARWQSDDQLHLTLRFIGAVDRRTAQDIAVMLATVRAPRFPLSIAGVGCFEHRGRIGTLWAGVTPHGAVTALHKKIDHLVADISGSHDHRTFAPHITLARFGREQRGVADFIAAHAALASAPFTVTEFGLFESHIEADGARYEEVARYALG